MEERSNTLVIALVATLVLVAAGGTLVMVFWMLTHATVTVRQEPVLQADIQQSPESVFEDESGAKGGVLRATTEQDPDSVFEDEADQETDSGVRGED